jgi:hypothetical protein
LISTSSTYLSKSRFPMKSSNSSSSPSSKFSYCSVVLAQAGLTPFFMPLFSTFWGISWIFSGFGPLASSTILS